MKKVVHFEVHFVILYSKTELLSIRRQPFFVTLPIEFERQSDRSRQVLCDRQT